VFLRTVSRFDQATVGSKLKSLGIRFSEKMGAAGPRFQNGLVNCWPGGATRKSTQPIAELVIGGLVPISPAVTEVGSLARKRSVPFVAQLGAMGQVLVALV
jgi:hypothetical protein